MKIAGFAPRPRTREVECGWLEPIEGAEPLRATIVANLTFEQVDYVTALLAKPNKTYAEIFEVVVPQVTAWNATALDQASGEYVAVPPPAEIGADALRVVDPVISVWLAWELAHSYRGGDERAGKSKPSGTTPEPDGVEPSTSPPPTGTKNPKSPPDSAES